MSWETQLPGMLPGEKCFAKFECWGLDYLYCVIGVEHTSFIHFSPNGCERIRFSDAVACVEHFEKEMAKLIANLTNPELWAIQAEHPHPSQVGR